VYVAVTGSEVVTAYDFCLFVCYIKTLNIKCVILSVLYGCETWSLTLRDDCNSRVFENRMLGECLDLRGLKGQGSGGVLIMWN
jgi:hypothetical protein